MNKKKIILLSFGAIALAATQGVFAAAQQASSAFTINATVASTVGIYCPTGTPLAQCGPQTIDFGNITPASFASPNTVIFQATMATNAGGSGTLMGYTVSDGASTFELKQAGTSNIIPLNVGYKDCSQSFGESQSVSDSTTAQALTAAQSSIAAEGGCGNYYTFNPTPGVGTGAFLFTIPAGTPPSAGTYQDVITVTVCNTVTCQ